VDDVEQRAITGDVSETRRKECRLCQQPWAIWLESRRDIQLEIVACLADRQADERIGRFHVTARDGFRELLLHFEVPCLRKLLDRLDALPSLLRPRRMRIQLQVFLPGFDGAIPK
jgi:hypothetical protein